jgi:uncharacterized protein (TIGR02246 family)
MPRIPLILLAALFAMADTTSCYRAGERDGQAEQQREIQQTHAADEAAIRAASAAWCQASVAKDLDKTISFYADDAVQFPNKAPAAKGKENIRKNWAPLLAQPGAGLSFQTTTVEVAHWGDIAYETGTYDFATTDKKGKTSDEKGKYVVVWKKQTDGSWKAAVDIDTPDH